MNDYPVGTLVQSKTVPEVYYRYMPNECDRPWIIEFTNPVMNSLYNGARFEDEDIMSRLEDGSAILTE